MASRDQAARPDNPTRAGADWRIFLPSVVLALLYGGLGLTMVLLGRGDTALARLLVLFVVVGVPVLLLNAGLRYATLEVRIRRRTLVYRRGWIWPRWRRVALRDIAEVSTAYGPAGHLLGGGTLVLKLTDGGRVRIPDVANVEAMAEIVRRRAAGQRKRVVSR